MFGYNLRLNVGDHVWSNSKELYSPERHITIDKYRDGCTRNPCCRDIVNKKIDLHSINDILYGTGVSGWDIRKNAFTMESLVDHLRDLGLKIQRSRIDKYEIIVEAVRP